MQDYKVKILTFEKFHGRSKGAVGSSILRGDWVINNWDKASVWTNGAYADVMIYQKAYWLYHMQDFKGIKILDMCDPDWMREDIKLAHVAKYLDAITCSTDALTDAVKGMVDIPVITIPDRLDMNQFPVDKKIHENQATTVCWFGYLHNAEVVLNMILPSLEKNGLNLVVVSDKDFHPSMSCGIEITNIRYNIANAYEHIRDCDFVVNPHFGEKNFKYKSNNKTLVSWALGNPVADTVEDLKRFIDPNERNKEVEIRSKEIQEKWIMKISIEQYEQLISQIWKNKNTK